jgi:hypothetical protein
MRTRSTIIGYAFLTILLTAGAAQSLSSSNTVFSDDIVDGAVTTADVRANAVTGSRILDNSVTGADIAESTLHPRLLTARVAQDLSTASTVLAAGGNATLVERSSAGVYTVHFGTTNLSTCSFHATSQTVPATFTTTAKDGATAQIITNGQPTGAVSVHFFRWNGSSHAPIDTSFSLTAVCP